MSRHGQPRKKPIDVRLKMRYLICHVHTNAEGATVMTTLGYSSSDDNPKIVLEIPDTIAPRITARSFRGSSIACAGNITRWPTLRAMLRDPVVRRKLLSVFASMPSDVRRSESTIHSVSVRFRRPIGWTLTSSIRNFAPWGLEPFAIPGFVRGLCVSRSVSRPAPLTSTLSFGFQLARNKDGWKIIVRSVYPGSALATHDGNISEYGQVLYHPDHRGAPVLS